MFEKELTYEDAQNIQKILESYKGPSKVIHFDSVINFLPGLDESLFEYYMNIISRISPAIVTSMTTSGAWRTRERIVPYLNNEGGFIMTYQRAEASQKEEEYRKELTKKDLELSIDNSEKALLAAKNSNRIAIISAVVALVTLLLSIFGKK